MRGLSNRLSFILPKGIQKQLADHLDVLEGKEVVFDGELGEVRQYFKSGVEHYLYPVYKSWCDG